MEDPTRKQDFQYDLTHDRYDTHPTKPHDIWYWIVYQYLWVFNSESGDYGRTERKDIQTSPDFIKIEDAYQWISKCEQENKKETN